MQINKLQKIKHSLKAKLSFSSFNLFQARKSALFLFKIKVQCVVKHTTKLQAPLTSLYEVKVTHFIEKKAPTHSIAIVT